LLILSGPRDLFSENELSAIKIWLNSGGRLLLMSNEAADKTILTNLNYLLQEYNILNPK
jgi:hypothetical protein